MLLVETTGNFQLRDFSTSKILRHEGATVVRNSTFIGERINAGQIRIIAQLNDEATDDEWLAYLRDSEDEDLARAAFVDAFKIEQPLVKVVEVVPQPAAPAAPPEPAPAPAPAPAPETPKDGKKK
jgi:hypothetical protein